MATLFSLSMGGVPGLARATTPGAQLWVKRFNGAFNFYDAATALGVSPDGSAVFVTGVSYDGSTASPGFGTVAYDASNGAELWTKTYDGGGNNPGAAATALGVSPDGSAVFVTGTSRRGGDYDYATVAYDASIGTRLWVARYDGTGNDNDTATALGVSPDGSAVFVTGTSYGSTSGVNYASAAYDASTGTELWVKHYNGSTNYAHAAPALGVSPDGTAVFVTGGSSYRRGRDYATIAYDASSGTTRWAKRYDGPANGADHATALEVSPDGSRVFVTGESVGSAGDSDYRTLAYDSSSGSEIWAERYDGPANGSDRVTALEVSPDGSEVFVTGSSVGSTRFSDYATVAYAASSGAEQWVKRYDGPRNRDDGATALGVSPDGSEVVVTGQSVGTTTGNDYATVAYDASSGAQQWAERYDGPGNRDDGATALGVNPVGAEVVVTGRSVGSTSNGDYATVAYGVG